MKRPLPSENEIIFGLNEMFFSTTDQRGIILDCNDVFRKISKYSLEELIGTPHNVIRHPDMPKLVFKVLWETILDGKPICAYVKNLAKDGSFYWVFATVIPVNDDFLSIRMKPTTHFLGIVEGLYKELLSVEKKSGVDASLEVLNRSLNSLGFPDYGSFVSAAISAELSSRYELQSKEMNQPDLTSTRESLIKIFNIINKLNTHTKFISEQLITIGEISKNIEFSALNTIIEAERLGGNGRALAVVAEHVSIGAAESKKLNENIRSLSTKMLELFSSTQLSVALSTLQVEMQACFESQWSEDPLSMTEERFKKNTLMLNALVDESLNVSKAALHSLAKDAHCISSELDQASQILMTLEFIQKTGQIESARLSDGSVFYQLFLTIMDLIKQSKSLYFDFSETINNIIKRDVDEAFGECEAISIQRASDF